MSLIERKDLNIGKPYLSDWNESMAIRELIANAIDETSDKKISINKIDNDKYEIINTGNELEPQNFMISEGNKAKELGKIGKFGIGLKDGIAVLMSRNIDVTIETSLYKYEIKYVKQGQLIKDERLFVYIYNNKRSWKGTRVVLNRCLDRYIEEAKKNFLIYRENYNVLDENEYGQTILEKNKNYNGTIYLNGIKIAYENKFHYSYNIIKESSELRRGISRERNNISREVFRDDIKNIIKNIESEDVLNKYLNSMIKSRDGSLEGEIQYTISQVKALKFCLEKRRQAVVFPTQRRGEMANLYKILSDKSGIVVINLLNSYYKRLKENKELIDKNIIAEYYKQTYNVVDIYKLSNKQKECFRYVEKFIYDNIHRSIISKITFVEENIYLYKVDGMEIIIPLRDLGSIRDCCLRILNTLEDSIEGGKNIKDEVLKNYVDIYVK